MGGIWVQLERQLQPFAALAPAMATNGVNGVKKSESVLDHSGYLFNEYSKRVELRSRNSPFFFAKWIVDSKNLFIRRFENQKSMKA